MTRSSQYFSQKTAKPVLFKIVFRSSIANTVRNGGQQCRWYFFIYFIKYLIFRAHAVRSIDRVLNELRYPHVEYPEMYLLDYGYKSLWSTAECRQICEPCSYIPMTHSSFSMEFKSARLERHHSMASLKPNGETSHREEKKKRCTRSVIRRNNSSLNVSLKSSSIQLY